MLNLIFIFLGGGLGSISRYGTGCLSRALLGNAFPIGTLCVNLLGCFAIGFLSAKFSAFVSPQMRNFFIAGFLGGFTTFSAFGLETMQLLQKNETGFAVLNIALNVVAGLGLTCLGLWLGASK